MAWYELHKKADSLTKREYLQVTEQRQYITAKTRDLQAVFANGILPGKQYRAEYVIDVKLFELAQAGDIKAVEKLEMRKRVRNTKR